MYCYTKIKCVILAKTAKNLIAEHFSTSVSLICKGEVRQMTY